MFAAIGLRAEYDEGLEVLVKLLVPLLALLFVTACANDGDDAENNGTNDTDVDTDTDTDTDEDTEPGPTTGPGVLGDETGLEAMCRRYVECGGTYYADQEACIQASYDYWGECQDAKDALNDLGACVADVECSEYDPDTYSPGAIGCGDEWDALRESSC